MACCGEDLTDDEKEQLQMNKRIHKQLVDDKKKV